jgi:RNA polymerase sigma-70 factor (ECF subfamily)
MDDDQRLSRIVTQWSVVRRAHRGAEEQKYSAQRELLDRYGGAVRRYLMASLRDADATDEVFQDFALRFVRGDFESAAPDYGKFRNFLRIVVSRMVVDYQRRRQRRHKHEVSTGDDMPPAVEPVSESRQGLDDFSTTWREDLLARAWAQLREVESRDGRPCYTILRYRVDHPGASSQELAEQLSVKLGKPLTAGNVRVLVHRARELFAEFILREIADSLDDRSPEHIERELIELRLHDYCREALQRRDRES